MEWFDWLNAKVEELQEAVSRVVRTQEQTDQFDGQELKVELKQEMEMQTHQLRFEIIGQLQTLEGHCGQANQEHQGKLQLLSEHVKGVT